MTRIELDAETARQIKTAAEEGGGVPMELVAPDGMVLLIASPTAAASVSEEEIQAALRSRANPGVQRNPAELRAWLSEQGIDWDAGA